jgi:hypothetical protein
MKVTDFINIVNQVKAKQPQFDYGMFEILIDGQPVEGVSLSLEDFAFNITSAEPDLTAPENLEDDGETAD